MKKGILTILLFSIYTISMSQTVYNLGSFGSLPPEPPANGPVINSNAVPLLQGKMNSLNNSDYTFGFPYEILYFPNVFAKLDASKGYYPDYIELNWDIENLESRITSFKIYRRPLDSTEDSILVSTVDANVRIWHDNYADANRVYKYTVYASGINESMLMSI